jgi:hypothetical protein
MRELRLNGWASIKEVVKNCLITQKPVSVKNWIESMVILQKSDSCKVSSPINQFVQGWGRSFAPMPAYFYMPKVNFFGGGQFDLKIF